MPFELPENVLLALKKLNACGYESYVVGGCVRDMLRGVKPHDYDICTSAQPEETRACFAGFRVIDTGIQHGTVTVIVQGEALEITTFRMDGTYLDGRHPQSVGFTRSLKEDLIRRDFTMNAMAYHPACGLADYYGGQTDCARHVIRCVGDPMQRFTEDALRILRALRFAAALGFEIEPETAAAMRALRERLNLISRERVAAELLRTVCAPGAASVLRPFAAVIQVALPEADAENAAAVLQNLPRRDSALGLAALFWHVPEARAQAGLASLRLPRSLERQVMQLVCEAQTPASGCLAGDLSRLGEEQLSRLIALRQAGGEIGAEEAEHMRREMRRIRAAGLPLKLADLAVNGRDLMQAGLRGAQIGQMLTALHAAVLREETPNERGALLRWAKDQLAKLSVSSTSGTCT